MARERRTRIPGVPKDAERNLESIVREFEDRIRKLERKAGRAGFVSGDTAASAGELLNIEAPAEGLTVILPEATPALRNARVTLNTRNANPVKVVAILGTVNGSEFVTNDSAGTFEAVCNGLDGWALPGYVTPGGSTPTWAQVLAAGNTSGASNPTLDAGQGLVVAGGQSAGSGDIRSASDVSVAAATDIHLHASGAIHIGHVATTQEIHAEADAIELLTDVNGINISSATTTNVTAGGSSTIQTGTFFAVNATGAIDLAAATTGEFTATTSLLLTGGGNGLAATAASFSMAAGTTGVIGNTNTTLQLRTAGSARFTVGTAGGWAIAGNEGSAGQYKRSGGAGAPPTWATISIGELGAIAANTFVGNITGSAAAPTANSLATLAGAGLTYAAGIMAVGAGTGITVNANDVQLSTVIAESFFGNFTAGVAEPTARAGSSVAGAGLTYTAGGTLAVGAGTNVTVNANDVSVVNFPLTGLADQAANTFLGNVTALAGKPTAVPGTTVAGAGLTYSIGGILAVGAGNAMQVNADDVAYIGSTSEITLNAPTGNQGTRDISTLACGGTYRVTNAASSFSIEGFTAKPGGFWFHFFWDETLSTDSCTLFYEDVTATAANRLILPRRTDLVSYSPISGILVYNATDARWHWIGDDTHTIGTNSLNFVRADVSGIAATTSASPITLTAGTAADISAQSGGDITLRADGTQVRVQATKLQLDGESGGTAGGFVSLAEASTSHVATGAGRLVVWAENTAPTRLMMTDDVEADWPVGYSAMGVNTTNPSVTNATTNLNMVSTHTIPANTLRAGSLYQIYAQYTLLETALAKNLTVEISYDNFTTIHGTVTFAGAGAAGTRYGRMLGLIRILTIGAGGTAMATLSGQNNHAGTEDGRMPTTVATATTAIDTTAARTIGMRIRMSATAAGNTITVVQGYILRLN